MVTLHDALADAPLAVPDALVAALADSWRSLGCTGTWLTAEQRHTAALEVRVATSCELCAARVDAVSPYAIERSHAASGPLSASMVDVVHRITTDPGRLSSRWHRELRDAGTSDHELVELTGIVSTVVSVDTLCRGIGAAPPGAPAASESTLPSKEVPAGLAVHSAWVPTVVPDRAEGQMADYYEAATSRGLTPNVFRSLTLVPDEAIRHRARAENLYSAARDIMNPEIDAALGRPQMELIAATVSAANDCFY